ncbi:MAG: ABC transporter ATP-binding protein [bacterium]|nr:ABC transporter ATP-binding protein [bacterium]
MLVIKNLEKDFGGIKAIHNCSLEVKKGTITGLIGPNGAGKTTLFNLISGIYAPDKGEIWFNGERIDGLKPHRIFRKRLMRTFQISRELQKMTVLENLMLIPYNQDGEGLSGVWFLPGKVKKQEKNNKKRAMEVLEFIELIHLKDEYAENLSTGQKKLLEIARTMMADPEMILLDEPGAGVNRTLMNKLVEDIKKINANGTTFLLIEHDMDLVMNLCDPIIVMNEGSKLTEGTAKMIKSDPRVLDAYLGV